MPANMTIEELLKSKEIQEIWTITPEATVYDALQTFSEKNIGGLPVIENGCLVGVFTERDYARKIILKGKCSLDTPVREVMTTDPIVVTSDLTVEECMIMMNEKHIRHLPVMDKGGCKLLGMVSMRDLVQAIISHQENRIEKLEGYIEGTGYGH